ncbi:hypothetical protein [Bacillus sp. FJAT-45066]|uniref:hypothetical protein n=1 Tax=Bacillus sp. FJAT-45066 TaxID=2011010 RepID=UPI000BB6AC41|nr:hypothetical protein [Bacillus sp. FJAT-45066]
MIRLANYLAPFGILRLLKMPMGYVNLPESKIKSAKEVGYRKSAYKTAYNELIHINESIKQLSQTQQEVITVPVYVITRGTFHKGNLSVETIKCAQEIWSNLHTKIAKKSTKGKQIIIEDSGHFIHCEKPKLVILFIAKSLS